MSKLRPNDQWVFLPIDIGNNLTADLWPISLHDSSGQTSGFMMWTCRNLFKMVIWTSCNFYEVIELKAKFYLILKDNGHSSIIDITWITKAGWLWVVVVCWVSILSASVIRPATIGITYIFEKTSWHGARSCKHMTRKNGRQTMRTECIFARRAEINYFLWYFECLKNRYNWRYYLDWQLIVDPTHSSEPQNQKITCTTHVSDSKHKQCSPHHGLPA
jgi:hypothetical protein